MADRNLPLTRPTRAVLALLIAALLMAMAQGAQAATTVRILFAYDEGSKASPDYLRAVVEHAQVYFTTSGVEADLEYAGQVPMSPDEVWWWSCGMLAHWDIEATEDAWRLDHAQDLVFYTASPATEERLGCEWGARGTGGPGGGTLFLTGDASYEAKVLAHEIGHAGGVAHDEAFAVPYHRTFENGDTASWCLVSLMYSDDVGLNPCDGIDSRAWADVFAGGDLRWTGLGVWHEPVPGSPVAKLRAWLAGLR